MFMIKMDNEFRLSEVPQSHEDSLRSLNGTYLVAANCNMIFSDSPGLTQVQVIEGCASFSNLAVSSSGTNWRLVFTVTSPPGKLHILCIFWSGKIKALQVAWIFRKWVKLCLNGWSDAKPPNNLSCVPHPSWHSPGSRRAGWFLCYSCKISQIWLISTEKYCQKKVPLSPWIP